MSDELLNILCRCKKGNLEEIASTEISLGPMPWDEADQVIFYECRACKQIFKRYAFILRGSNSKSKNSIYEFSELIPYDGELTKQEIIDNVPTFIGDIYKEDIKKIKAQRGK
jgi:hypothetical protein